MTFSDRSGRSVTATRRQLLAGGAAATLLATGLGHRAACARSGDPPREVPSDDTARLQALIDRGDARLPRGRHVIDRQLLVRGGCRVAIEGGSEIVYRGASPGGVFRVVGADVVIESVGGGDAVIACERPRRDVWAVEAVSPRGLRVTGIAARECNHVRVRSSASGYGDVRTTGRDANVGTGIVIQGGGARFKAPPGDGSGACWIEYAFDWSVDGAVYENVSHGIEWWGGNANFDADGALANERKCGRFVIRDVTVRGAVLGGIWGAMGRSGLIERCTVERCGDVCLDAEGCTDIRFVDCAATDGHNGALATFFGSSNVVFENCRVASARADWPLYRSYNASLDATSGGTVTLRNCHFTCRDATAPGTVDTRSGPLRLLTVEGCTFSNVRIDTAFNNMHRVSITGNTLAFPYGSPTAPAIRTGASRAAGGLAGGATIARNRLSLAAAADAGIAVVEDDYNHAARSSVRANTISGPVARGVVMRNDSANAGIRPHFDVADNIIDGASRPGAAERGKTAAPLSLVWRGNRTGQGRTLPPP